MMNPEVLLLQRKIAGYPEQIDKMQKRYSMVLAPKAATIESAIKGLNAYIIQLKVNDSSFTKVGASISEDLARLEEVISEETAGGKELSESLRMSYVQLQHASATVETYKNAIGAQLDSARTALDTLTLAQKHKKTLDVVNLLSMIEKGDGYKL